MGPPRERVPEGYSRKPYGGSQEVQDYPKSYQKPTQGGPQQQPRTQGAQFVRLSDYITEDNRTTCVKIRGLPFSTSVKEIREFFADFRIAERDIILDKSHGQMTGYALVFLTDDKEAERAKVVLDRQYVGSRYVDVFTPDVHK
jgi:hypothetical protein